MFEPSVREHASFPVRNLKFAVDASVPRHWHGGRKSVTSFLDNLSIFFPAGERFFMRSVRAFERRVKDPTLKDEMRAFYGQEAIHTREHLRYNEHLASLGYPAVEMDARVERLIAFFEKRIPRRWSLCATASLEHFTSLLAHLVLGDRRIFDGANPTMAALWRWHSAEEAEHRAVAFDVYEAVGGNYPERATIMVFTAVIFWAKVLEHQVRMMHADGNATNVREWVALGRFMFVDPGGMLTMVPGFLRWFSPGFHPNDLDTEALIEAWRLAQAN